MAIAAATKRRITQTLATSIYDNPIVTREFRTRMRGQKAFVIMGTYALFLCVVLCITFYSEVPAGASLVNRNIGLDLFQTMTWAQAILLALIVPALTSSSLTQELENKTIEMLALTRLSGGKTILGKQISGFLYSLVLLVCSVPLAGMCLMLGGISPAEIGITYALLVAWSFLFASTGVFFSSLFNRTAAATLMTYGSCLAYTLFSSAAAASYPFGSNPFALLNPGFSSTYSLEVARIYGTQVPLAVVAFGLHVSMGILLLLVASTHVRHLRAERAFSIRLVLLMITVGLTWLLAGYSVRLFPGMSTVQGVVMVQTGIPALVLLAVGACMFATGVIKKPQTSSMFAYALSPAKIFSSDLGGGISFMALWTTVTYAAFGTFIWWADKSTSAALSPDFLPLYCKVSLAAVAIVVGISAVGVLISSLVPSRKSAAALVLVVIALLFTFYGITLAYYEHGVSSEQSPAWQTAAIWPMTPFVTAAGGWTADMPTLKWPKRYSWLVSIIVYLSLGALALATASPAQRKYGGVKEE